MMEIKTQTVARVVPKEQLAFMKDDKGFTDYLIKDLNKTLFDAVMGELENGERIVKLSDLRVSEVLETNMVEYRKHIKFTDLVRCKDCKHWDTSWQNDYAPNYHYCLLVDGTRRDDFYCADAERRTDE